MLFGDDDDGNDDNEEKEEEEGAEDDEEEECVEEDNVGIAESGDEVVVWEADGADEDVVVPIVIPEEMFGGGLYISKPKSLYIWEGEVRERSEQ